MATELEVQNLVEKLQGSGKSFSEFLAELFKDRFLEIYLGDSYEDVSVEQTSTSYPAVICGKVIAAYGECLIINGAFVIDSEKPGKTLKVQLGNLIFINEGSICMLKEIDGNGILDDMFLRSRHSLEIKKHFIK